MVGADGQGEIVKVMFYGKHLNLSFIDIREVVDCTLNCLISKDFSTIAYRGHSGAIVGPAIAYLLEKNLVLIRKEENAHSASKIEGKLQGKYVIIDDFIDTGETVSDILRTLGERNCIGIFLYDTQTFLTVKSFRGR